MQKPVKASLKDRAKWYLLGFVLFFGPIAIYPRLMQLLTGEERFANIHSVCLRMPIGNLFTGKVALHGVVSVSFISFLLLIISAFFLGPFFCGRLCAAGAVPEYLSRIIPDRWKINWAKIVNPTPVRYGFFAAFLIAPFLAQALTCNMCQFALLQKCVDTNFGVMSSMTILTLFFWLVLFGIFNVGGRGYCNFMCPVGALQNLVHSIGARFGFTYKLRLDRERCTSCGICVKECPMGVLSKNSDGLSHKIHNCLTCRHCERVCPKGALSYGTGDSGWKETGIKMPGGPDVPVDAGK